MVTINDLPQELLELILYFISPYDDIKSCRLVCRRWYLSCLEVVKKRKSRFISALKSGHIEWFKPSLPKHLSITQRYSHSSCIYDSSMYVFGGCITTNTTFNDLWKFDLGSHEWSRILTMGNYPSPKAYASMVNWEDYLILFGGWTHPSVYPLHQQWVLFSELHFFNISVNKWSQAYYDGSPPPTAGHTATVYDNFVIIFGGLQKQEVSYASTNDIFCLDIKNHCWFKPIVSKLRPLARYGHSQIKIDNQHILIMAGCGGSNKLYSDVWLLTLPKSSELRNSEWIWECVEVQGLNNYPSQMWYNPACKVDNEIVVLSTWQGSNPTKGDGGKMQQLLVPGIVRQQASNWIPPVDHPNNEIRPVNPINVPDMNINGQRGVLRSAQNNEDERPRSVKPRLRPSIRPNASCDRERRLEVLSKMEDRLRSLSQVKSSIKQKNKNIQFNAKNILVPHLLDISQVVTCKTAAWLPIALNEDGHPPFLGSPPSPCVLYSLLLGRGHLIMFGGIPNDPAGGHSSDHVSNSLAFISAPFLSLTL